MSTRRRPATKSTFQWSFEYCQNSIHESALKPRLAIAELTPLRG